MLTEVRIVEESGYRGGGHLLDPPSHRSHASIMTFELVNAEIIDQRYERKHRVFAWNGPHSGVVLFQAIPRNLDRSKLQMSFAKCFIAFRLTSLAQASGG